MNISKEKASEISKRILEGKNTIVSADEFKKLLKAGHPLVFAAHACEVAGFITQVSIAEKIPALASTAQSFQKLISDAPAEVRALAIGILAARKRS